MPRPLTGRVRDRRLNDGSLAFDVVIRDRSVTVGYAPDWTQKSVESLLENKLLPRAKLNEPWWEEITPSSAPRTADLVTFREVASETVLRYEGRYTNNNTLNAYKSPLMKHVGPFFSWDGERERMVSEINGALVSEFTKAKVREREVLSDLADTLQELNDDVLRDPRRLREQLDTPEEWTLLVRYGQRGGRVPLVEALEDGRGKISLSSRGLSNNEINRCLARLRDVLKTARIDFKIDLGDPTEDRSLPRTDPARSWLLPFHLQAVFDAAAELDLREPKGGPDYRELGREALVVLLALGGPRVSEVGAADWHDAHLAAATSYVEIKDSKTSAGKRNLRLYPLARDALRRRKAVLNPRGTDPIFATFTGGRRDRNSIRNRMLIPILKRADEILDEHGLPLLPERTTPHTFRRTCLTYMAWADVPMRRTMAHAGHKDSKLTLEVYQQDFPDDPLALEWIRFWFGFGKTRPRKGLLAAAAV
jgi:integrase